MKRIVLSSCVMLAVVVLAATAALAADPVASCQARKLKAWAKLRSCEHKTSAKVVLGATVDPTACQTKFDAALAKVGTGCRYLDNGDGTVTDLDTGLMWQKTDDNGGLTDKDNTYSWSDTGTAPDGGAFTDFLAGLNDCESTFSDDFAAVSGGYAGHCDWRLPQIDELHAIHAIADDCFPVPGSCIDQTAFGPTNGASYYWSATSVVGNPDLVLVVGFQEGSLLAYTDKYLFSERNSVRAVRSGL